MKRKNSLRLKGHDYSGPGVYFAGAFREFPPMPRVVTGHPCPLCLIVVESRQSLFYIHKEPFTPQTGLRLYLVLIFPSVTAGEPDTPDNTLCTLLSAASSVTRYLSS
jgi:hypothetical protein